MRHMRWLMFAFLALMAIVAVVRAPQAERGASPVAPADAPPARSGAAPRTSDARLPPEVATTLALIEAGGPFPYERDGLVFGNFEGRLPPRARGWYREYTVPTPGLSHRGARRIVAGGEPAAEFWYTDDHYATFRRIGEPR